MAQPTSADTTVPASAFVSPLTRAPLVPEPLLRRHDCFIPGDTRFRAAARLRQSLWRDEQGLAPGLHRPGGQRALPRVTLGSTLLPADAARGLNFLSSTVHTFVRRCLVLREEGAFVNYERLHRNLLSSEPLTYNLFVPLALDRDLATAVFRQLLPTFVERVIAIRFETSPGRHQVCYLDDGTAFDAALTVITPDGEEATVFIEIKYSESCSGPPATHRSRYDEAARELALHRDPDALVLRSIQLEQFFRLHLLAGLAVRHLVTPRAHLLVLAPQLNRHVAAATRLYAAELIDPAGSSDEAVGFSTLALETFVLALAQAGGGAEAAYLHHRYLDLRPVLDLVLADAEQPDPEPQPPASPTPALPPPSATASTSDGAPETPSDIPDTEQRAPSSPTRPAPQRPSKARATSTKEGRAASTGKARRARPRRQSPRRPSSSAAGSLVQEAR